MPTVIKKKTNDLNDNQNTLGVREDTLLSIKFNSKTESFWCASDKANRRKYDVVLEIKERTY